MLSQATVKDATFRDFIALWHWDYVLDLGLGWHGCICKRGGDVYNYGSDLHCDYSFSLAVILKMDSESLRGQWLCFPCKKSFRGDPCSIRTRIQYKMYLRTFRIPGHELVFKVFSVKYLKCALQGLCHRGLVICNRESQKGQKPDCDSSHRDKCLIRI